jgi:hypothetical protein
VNDIPIKKMKALFALCLIALVATSLQAALKKLLVVTTTTRFRHSSIPTAEKFSRSSRRTVMSSPWILCSSRTENRRR